MGIVYLLERKSKESSDLAKLISQLETNVDMVSRNKNCTRFENNVINILEYFLIVTAVDIQFLLSGNR